MQNKYKFIQDVFKLVNFSILQLYIIGTDFNKNLFPSYKLTFD